MKKRSGIDCQIHFYETERCTELFFIYYFKYTTQKFQTSDDVETLLNKICGYDKTLKFFRGRPLHQFFEKQGGNFADAIANANSRSLMGEKETVIILTCHPHVFPSAYGKTHYGVAGTVHPCIIPKEKGRIAEAVGTAISDNLISQKVLEKYLLSDNMVGRVRASIEDFIATQKGDSWHKSHNDV